MNTPEGYLDTAQSYHFTLNTGLDPVKLADEFQRHGRIRVRNFLQSDSAVALYQYLFRDARWDTFFVLDGEVTRRSGDKPLTPDIDERSLKYAYEAADVGFAYIHDATSLFPEDLNLDVTNRGEVADPVLSAFGKFLRSSPFLEFARALTGCSELRNAEAIATRFRKGHFMTFHSAISRFDQTGKRKAVFFLNLTPEWKPERGGLTEFRSQVADVVEAYVPCFNTLDVITFPQGYWISPVAPFVRDPMLAMSGRLYVS